ncbi:DNA primase [Haloferula luteola]|uniref:DNA primase n=1 Tax=Haloferula luteola TaxID=595692 RepID=A0A840V947_9BACT|nr:DNA primase [Haloferula luteola]
MPQISRETVEQVLAATDIVDLISSYIPVKRAGTRFQALCPFHNEKTPSFSIDPSKQFFHCFGCKKSGDAIHFVRELENLTFTDAVRKLAQRVGIEVEERTLDPREERERRQRGQLLDLHREASRFFHSLLLRSPAAAHAREYLKSRGFGKEMAERWEVGWAPDASKVFLDWARDKGLRGRELVDSGLALQRESGGLYLRFRDRLMFPVRNDHGDVIAFSGRQLREDPRSGKYINSPETALFKKSQVLFALDRARKAILEQKAALICEGQMDAVACHEAGLEHAIAGLGTAFTAEHAKRLRRYTKAAVLCYDSDNAGFTGSVRAFRELAKEGLAVRAVRMPKGEDPDSYMQKNGTDAFRDLIERSQDFFDFFIDRAQGDGKLNDPQQRAEVATECASMLAEVPDLVARDALLNHIATRLRTGAPELREAVRRAGRKPSYARPERPSDSPAPVEAPPPAPLDRRIGTLCSLALGSATARDWLGEQFETLHELARYLEGVAILQTILTGRPDPESPASINSFLGGLPEPQQRALRSEPSFSDPLPEDPVASAEITLADASALALEREDSEIKTRLGEPTLPMEEQLALLQRAKEIAELLSSLPARAVRNDRFGPSSRRPPRRGPPDSKDFRDKRKS